MTILNIFITFINSILNIQIYKNITIFNLLMFVTIFIMIFMFYKNISDNK